MDLGEVHVDPVHDEFFKAQDLADALVRESNPAHTVLPAIRLSPLLPPRFFGVRQRRLDQNVEITRRPIRHVRQNRNPPDHYISHVFSVETGREIGKVLRHDRVP